MQLELEDHEAELLTHWVLTGQWASRDVASSLVIERLGGGRGDCLLGLAVTGGRIRGRLSLKKRSWEPQWLEVDTAAGTERWEYANWKIWQSGPRLPGRIKHMCVPSPYNAPPTHPLPFPAPRSPTNLCTSQIIHCLESSAFHSAFPSLFP